MGINEILESEEGVEGRSEVVEDSEVMEIHIGGWWEMWKCLGLTLIGSGSDEILGILWRRWRSAGSAGSSRVGEEGLEMLSPVRDFKTSVGNTGGQEGVCWKSKAALESLGSSVT